MDVQKNRRQSRTAPAGRCMVEVAPEREELEPFLLSGGGGGKRKGNCNTVHPGAGDRGWLGDLIDRILVECNSRKTGGITTVAA